MNFTRTAVTIGASTAVGFVGDLLMYSLAASKGGKFTIVFPKGKELFNVLALGVVGGIVLDFTLKSIENGLKNKEEKALDQLVEREKEKIYQGLIVNKDPQKILWANPSTSKI